MGDFSVLPFDQTGSLEERGRGRVQVEYFAVSGDGKVLATVERRALVGFVRGFYLGGNIFWIWECD